MDSQAWTVVTLSGFNPMIGKSLQISSIVMYGWMDAIIDIVTFLFCILERHLQNQHLTVTVRGKVNLQQFSDPGMCSGQRALQSLINKKFFYLMNFTSGEKERQTGELFRASVLQVSKRNLFHRHSTALFWTTNGQNYSMTFYMTIAV